MNWEIDGKTERERSEKFDDGMSIFCFVLKCYWGQLIMLIHFPLL